MWLEVKTVLTVVSFVFIAIVLSQLILVNMLLSFLLFMVMGLYLFGDIVIGYQISHKHLNVLLDPTRPDGYFYRGLVFMRSKNLDCAIVDFNQCLALILRIIPPFSIEGFPIS